MTNFAAQRAHMVHSQLMPNTVTDPRLLAAMRDVPREMFVPPERRAVAYADRPIALGQGRFMLDPMTLARLIQLAGIGEEDRVLIIGGCTGYSMAIVARLCREALAIDEDDELASATMAGIARAPHAAGLPDKAPFDAIIVEGRVPLVPKALLDQLAEGGRLVAIIGDAAAAKAILYSRSNGTIGERQAFDAPAPALPGFAAMRTEFVF